MKRFQVLREVGFCYLVVKLTISQKLNNILANMPCSFPYFISHFSINYFYYRMHLRDPTKRFRVHPKVGFRISVMDLTISCKVNYLFANVSCSFPNFIIHFSINYFDYRMHLRDPMKRFRVL
jgi:hypothetical protein